MMSVGKRGHFNGVFYKPLITNVLTVMNQ